MVVSLQGGDSNRTISTSESVASTMTAPSDDDLTSDEDNGEDNGDTSDTASAPSPAAVGSHGTPLTAGGGSISTDPGVQGQFLMLIG